MDGVARARGPGRRGGGQHGLGLARVDPELGCALAGHLILLARRGVCIFENLALEELAASGHHRFEFVCTPLKLVGATGSPVRPLAIVPG